MWQQKSFSFAFKKYHHMFKHYPSPIHYSITTPSGIIPAGKVSLSTQLILTAAENLGISWESIPNTQIFKLTYQHITRFFHQQRITQTLEIGFDICLDKCACKEFLTRAQITVPSGFYIPQTHHNYHSLVAEIYAVTQKPLVVKPSRGEKGEHITMGISTLAELQSAVTQVLSHASLEEGALIEETCKGDEFRILATKEKVLGIVKRVPANVTGDGKHTIAELITIKNSDPLRSSDPSAPRVTIHVDEKMVKFMTKNKYSLDTVIESGQQIFLRQNSNISTGGDSYDFTESAHPSVNELAVKIVNAIPGVEIVGIDFMTEDITKPQDSNSYAVLELNGSPGIYLHHFPYSGTSRNCALEYVLLMFPEMYART